MQVPMTETERMLVDEITRNKRLTVEVEKLREVVKAMRSTLIRTICTCGPADDPDVNAHADYCRVTSDAALSPDAGRALAVEESVLVPQPERKGTPIYPAEEMTRLKAEVEKLREHAQDAHEDLGHPDGLMSTATWQYCEQHPCRKLRDALAAVGGVKDAASSP